jgi:hypothetical protein
MRMASFDRSLSPWKSYSERDTTSFCHFSWFCFTFFLFSRTPLAKSSLHEATVRRRVKRGDTSITAIHPHTHSQTHSRRPLLTRRGCGGS